MQPGGFEGFGGRDFGAGGDGGFGEDPSGAAAGTGDAQGDDERVEKAREIPAAELLSWVRGQLGKPYVFGADGPGSYDCSGLVMRAYGRYGVKMPHKAADQASFGRPVGKGSAMPGDLIFFNLGRGRNSHVGIITGANRFIEAPRTGLNVRETTLNDFYRSRITAVRRLPNVIQGQASTPAQRGSGGATAGMGARPTPAGTPSPSPTGSVGTGSAVAGGSMLGQLGAAAAAGGGPVGAAVGAAAGAADTAGSTAADTFGRIADSIKDGLAPLMEIPAIADKVFSAFIPTTLVRVACGITGVVCLVAGFIMIASEGKNG